MTTLAPFEFKNDTIAYSRELMDNIQKFLQTHESVTFECYGTFTQARTLSRFVDLIYDFENVKEIGVSTAYKCDPKLFTKETPLCLAHTIYSECVVFVDDITKPVKFTCVIINNDIRKSFLENLKAPTGLFYEDGALFSISYYEKIFRRIQEVKASKNEF